MLIQRPGGARQHFLGGGITVRSGGGGAAAVATYAEILRDTYGASEIWPLVNIASGTTIPAFINSARNGVLTGWDLQNAAGPVPGTLAPLSDGVNDFGNIYTTGGGVGLADIFNGGIGSAFMFLRASGAGMWTDGTVRFALIMGTGNGTDRFEFRRPANNNQITVRYMAGGVLKSVSISLSDTDHFSLGISFRDGANGDEMKAFKNGAQTGSTQTGLGTFGGTVDTGRNAIGSQSGVVAQSPWSGLLSYVTVKFGSIWTPAEFAAMHAAAATAGADA